MICVLQYLHLRSLRVQAFGLQISGSDSAPYDRSRQIPNRSATWANAKPSKPLINPKHDVDLHNSQHA